jgi:hypothetical protein
MRDDYPSFLGTHSFQRSWLTLTISLLAVAIHLSERTRSRGRFRIQLSQIGVEWFDHVRLSHVCVMIGARICLMWACNWAYFIYLSVWPGVSRLCGCVQARISSIWVYKSVYLHYVGAYLGLFPLIGALSRSHSFQDPHNSNDLVFVFLFKVPQLVHLWCFWFPVRGDWVGWCTQIVQVI